jgi:acetyl-CoA/propionyl-CoA carboxylase biotin carboxyl carrier protein
MQSSVVKIAVAEGDAVEVGQTIIVLEAMKMEQPIKAHKAGTIKNITAEVGTTVPAGTHLMDIED